MKHKIVPFLILLVTMTACVPVGISSCAAPPPPAAPPTSAADPTAVPINTEAESTATPIPRPTETPSAETEAVEPTPLVTMTVPVRVDDVEETEAAQPAIEDITFNGANDLELHATLYRPGGLPPFPAVILLHMIGDDRSVWADGRTGLARTLMSQGYAVLAVDMRGHGETGSGRDWALAETDLQMVWLAFTMREDVDAARTAVVGGSIGSNMALRLAARQPEIKTAVLLSPGLDYRRVTTEDALAVYGGRPLLIVASRDDDYSSDSAIALQGQAPDTAELLLFDTAGHGTDMLTTQPELTERIVNWLSNHIRPQP